MSNFLEFKINEQGHAIIKYVGDEGRRMEFDLTTYIDAALCARKMYTPPDLELMKGIMKGNPIVAEPKAGDA